LAFVEEAVELRIGLFAWLDVLVSAVVLLQFIDWEGKRMAMKRLWVPSVATVLVGVSCGLPLFLFMRERQRDEQHLLGAGTS
jgi:hypothetical protein